MRLELAIEIIGVGCEGKACNNEVERLAPMKCANKSYINLNKKE